MVGALVPPPGGKGLFTAALEEALVGGEIDIAVHSLKDLPTDLPPGLMIGAIQERAGSWDMLVGRIAYTLSALPPGAAVGTSSSRRAAQLKRVRRDVVIHPIRGNVGTRLEKMERGDVDVVVLAAAGLERLGIQHAGAVALASNEMLPAPGQGALAVQCRTDDDRVRALLAPIECSITRAAVTAERSFLHALGGGCSVPIAALATTHANGTVDLQGLVCDLEGEQTITLRGSGSDPVGVGQRLADEFVARGAEDLIANA